MKQSEERSMQRSAVQFTPTFGSLLKLSMVHQAR